MGDKVKIENFQDVVDDIKKSVYKSVLKSLRSKNRDNANAIVDDVLDPNNIAEVDPDKIPPKKQAVINKNEKGIYLIKKFVENKRGFKKRKDC